MLTPRRATFTALSPMQTACAWNYLYCESPDELLCFDGWNATHYLYRMLDVGTVLVTMFDAPTYHCTMRLLDDPDTPPDAIIDAVEGERP